MCKSMCPSLVVRLWLEKTTTKQRHFRQMHVSEINTLNLIMSTLWLNTLMSFNLCREIVWSAAYKFLFFFPSTAHEFLYCWRRRKNCLHIYFYPLFLLHAGVRQDMGRTCDFHVQCRSDTPGTERPPKKGP